MLNKWLQNLFLLSGRCFQNSILTRTEVLTTVPWWTGSLHNKCLEGLAPATFLPCCLHSCPSHLHAQILLGRGESCCLQGDLLLISLALQSIIKQLSLSTPQLHIGGLPHSPFVFSTTHYCILQGLLLLSYVCSINRALFNTWCLCNVFRKCVSN